MIPVRSTRFTTLCVVTLTLLTSLPARAEDPSGAAAPAAPVEPADTFFDSTTVTALGHEAKTLEIATPVTVIGPAELERRLVAQPADLLRDQPGVDVNGVGLNQVRPVIRGQRGLRVLFLADGLRLNNARRQTDFGEITGLFDLEEVESVEVVRGPASVLYGSDAIGGVFNLVSRTTPRWRRRPRWGRGPLRLGRRADPRDGLGGRSQRSLGLSARRLLPRRRRLRSARRHLRRHPPGRRHRGSGHRAGGPRLWICR